MSEEIQVLIMLSYAKVFMEILMCFLGVGILLAVRPFSTELRFQMSHDEPSKSTVAYHALVLARVSKAIETCSLIVHLITFIFAFMAEGNTCAVLSNQLPWLNLLMIFERNRKYRFWAVVGLQQASACGTN